MSRGTKNLVPLFSNNMLVLLRLIIAFMSKSQSRPSNVEHGFSSSTISITVRKLLDSFNVNYYLRESAHWDNFLLVSHAQLN